MFKAIFIEIIVTVEAYIFKSVLEGMISIGLCLHRQVRIQHLAKKLVSADAQQ